MIAERDWSEIKVVGVSRLANYLKRKLEADRNLIALGVKGEVSNLRVQSSGSWNFDVKDRDATLACFAFPTDAAAFPAVKNGDEITAFGRISTFEKRSAYQLVVRHVEQAGIGRLFARYEELRRKLEREGLFRDDRKKPLPRFPFRVALVGSPSGEGTRDFLTQARGRAPQVSVQLVETPVQGDVAPQIIAAIERACALRPDLVVLARGGGSFEDLFVFSDERVVRAIAGCRLPIVTAIGHEGDVPLGDLAADKRCSTPSTAAQTVLPAREALLRDVRRDAALLTRSLRGHVQRARHRLDRIERRSPLADPRLLLAGRRQRLDAMNAALDRASPANRLTARRVALERLRLQLDFRFLAERKGRVDDLAERLGPAYARIVERRRHGLALVKVQLDGNDPTALLARGYAIVRRADGAVVRDPAAAPPGTALRVTLAHGELAARVEPEKTDAGEQVGLF